MSGIGQSQSGSKWLVTLLKRLSSSNATLYTLRKRCFPLQASDNRQAHVDHGVAVVATILQCDFDQRRVKKGKFTISSMRHLFSKTAFPPPDFPVVQYSLNKYARNVSAEVKLITNSQDANEKASYCPIIPWQHHNMRELATT